MNIYVIDASVAVKWYVPELYQQVTWRLLNPENHLHVPEFFLLEFGNFLGKKQRRGELTFEESLFILRKMEEVPLHWHPDGLLFPKAFQLANETYRSLYDCLYLSLAIAIDGQMVTADLKFYESLKTGPYASRLLWVEDIPESKE
jgi:predicted nucleic acid-binding protein